MIKNILVPTDGSALSSRAVKDAAALAKSLGARVTGFHVAPSYHIEMYADYVPPDMMTPQEHAANAKRAAQSHLDFVNKPLPNTR